MAVVCAEEEEEKGEKGEGTPSETKPRVIVRALLDRSYVTKKAKCAYENMRPPATTRSLPNLTSTGKVCGYVNASVLPVLVSSFESEESSFDESKDELENGYGFDCPTPVPGPFPVPARKLPEELYLARDWTGEFQAIMASAPRLERGALLHKLSEEFVSAATQIGRVIIRERNLPIFEKSVLPLSGKGVAGGEKFIQNSIFFKYAIDSHQLYGGNDEHAMKVAGHELKGGTALMSCGMMLGLNFGLMCLIDYRGYRLIATSSLPISQDTIVYGSCDGGHTVHADNSELNSIMEKCFKILNLKGHTAGIGSSTKFIYGPCDIEGHVGRDGKFYVVDVARIWPPETPNASLQGSFLYKLLRPELVSRYPKPLSSDAFSLFGRDNSAEHDAEVVEATRFLLDKVIPDFAQALAADEKELKPWRIVEELHRAGINTRHLGRVRALIPLEKVRIRNVILEELICRALKNGLRLQMRKLASSEDSDYEVMAADFFNQVFCLSANSHNFWRVEIPKALQTRFPRCLSEEELSPDYDLRDSIDMQLIFKRLQDMTGVRFHCQELDRTRAFTSEDVEGIVVIEKHMYATPRIEADTAAELARQKTGSEAETLLGVAIEKYNSVLELKTDDYVVMSNLGNVLAELAKLKASNQCFEEAESLFQRAYAKFELCLRIRPEEFKTWVTWADTLASHLSSKLNLGPQNSERALKEIEALYESAQNKYAMAYQLNPLHPSTLFNWANLNYNVARLKMNSESELAEQMLVGSETLYKQCYSYKQDPDVLINWGCLLLRLSKLKLNQEEDERNSSESGMEVEGAKPQPRLLLQQAKEKFLEAERLNPGIGTYNIACVCALLKQEEECKQWLTRFATSSSRLECLLEDEDLSVFRKRDWFLRLVHQQSTTYPLSSSPSPLELCP